MIQPDEMQETPLDRVLTRYFLQAGVDESHRELLTTISLHLRNGSVCVPIEDKTSIELLKHPMIGNPEDSTPLVIDQGKIFFRRYWEYEREISDRILGFDATASSQETDPQMRAIDLATQLQFLVISGGPGTGKTWVVAKLLEALLLKNPTLRIRLAAPTGKAAARLDESIQAEWSTFDPQIQLHQPDPASTLHRLLGFRPQSILPRFGTKRRLPLDVLIVDEASMVDLALMAKTFRALPEGATLILLGDKDQLSSVEAGAVLGSLWEVANLPNSTIAENVVLLTKNRRFGENSGIGLLATAFNQGEVEKAKSILADETKPDAAWCKHSIEDLVEERIAPLLAEKTSVETAFDIFDSFQFLCATRVGDAGVEAINMRVTEALGFDRNQDEWYHGRPIMITTNDYSLHLFNGDIGITWLEEDGIARVRFRTQDGIRSVHPSRLPQHETVYAMTVHKSQGAQFDDVVLILPEYDVPILTRELVYTGITRARQTVSLMGTPANLTLAVERRIERHSGLMDKLRPEPST